MGVALGRIGLSYDDFCRLTFSEFDEVVVAWSEGEERRRADGWERARALGVWTLQPHLKKGVRLTPSKLLPLPWDGAAARGKGKGKGNGIKDDLTPAERRARMERLRDRLSKL